MPFLPFIEVGMAEAQPKHFLFRGPDNDKQALLTTTAGLFPLFKETEITEPLRDDVFDFFEGINVRKTSLREREGLVCCHLKKYSLCLFVSPFFLKTKEVAW